MKAAQILSALNLFPKSHKEYGSKLENICKIISLVNKLPGYGFELGAIMGNLEYIQTLPVLVEPEIKEDKHGHKTIEYSNYLDKKAGHHNEKNFIGLFGYVHLVKVFHNAGSYTFYIPTDNDFCNYVMGLIGANVVIKEKETAKPVFEAILSSLFITQVKTALPFVGRDTLRPAMTGICIEIKGDCFNLAATDGHRLYVGQSCLSDSSDNVLHRFIIPLAKAKEIAALKRKDKEYPVTLLVYKEALNTWSDGNFDIEGVKGQFIDARFPEYQCVIPENPYTLEVSREELLSHIRQNLGAANKVTNAVRFYLNGNVKIECCDKDMELESTTQFDYVKSNVPDMSISFNGKLLSEVLKSSKSKNVRIELSTSSRAGIFKDDLSNDLALLMPYQL